MPTFPSSTRARLIAGLVLFAAIGSARADSRPDRWYIGLLRIAMLPPESCPDPKAPAIDVFSSHDQHASRLGTVETIDRGETCRAVVLRNPSGQVSDVPTMELTYGGGALIALERRSGWWRIRLGAGSGWISSKSVIEFRSYTDLIIDNELGSVRREWNQRLYAAPGGGSRRWSDRTPPVRVTGDKRVRGRLWLRIEILQGSPCDGVPVKAIADGWIPAYSPEGLPLVAVPPRGC